MNLENNDDIKNVVCKKGWNNFTSTDFGYSPPLSLPVPVYVQCSRQVESKTGLDYTEFNAATPDTSCRAVNGETLIRSPNFSINFRQWPPPSGNTISTTNPPHGRILQKYCTRITTPQILNDISMFQSGLWIRIRIQWLCGSGSVLGIRICIGNPDPGARKWRNFSGKMHILVIFI
jgi:hypothetical protein